LCTAYMRSIIELVPHVRADQNPYGDVFLYLTEPAPEKHWAARRLINDLSRRHHRASEGSHAPAEPPVAFGGQTRELPPVFASQTRLSRGRLAAALNALRVATDKPGSMTLDRRLQLGRPEGNVEAGWTMKCRMRRLTSLHWVPVVVEIWPVYGDYARMTLSPESRVLASKRYFRLGHKVLELLWAHLAALSVPPTPHPLKADVPGTQASSSPTLSRCRSTCACATPGRRSIGYKK
jgi:hypothetical protein